MKFIRNLSVRLLAVALAVTAVPAAVPANTPLIGISKAEAQYRYYGHRGGYYGGRGFDRGRGYRGPGRYYGRGGYYGGNRRYHRRNNDGAAIAAGIIGLGVGAAIANSARPRYYEPRPVYRSYGGGLSAHDRYCLSRYRSYDPASGTYQPYNGPRRYCR